MHCFVCLRVWYVSVTVVVMCDIIILSKLQSNQTHFSKVNFPPSYSQKVLHNLKSLTPLPPSYLHLQITEASFMGGTYPDPALTPWPGYVPPNGGNGPISGDHPIMVCPPITKFLSPPPRTILSPPDNNFCAPLLIGKTNICKQDRD